MSYSTVITCDQCGKQKGEANHWFMVEEFATGIEFFPWSAEWREYQHVCGEACAQRWLSQEMAKWAKPAAEVEVRP